MSNAGASAVSVRFRTLIAREWTPQAPATGRRARAALARDLRYVLVEGR